MNPSQRGFVLLPVVLAITLIAAIAYMLNREGAVGARMASGILQSEQARHVAQAGLEHAEWAAQASGCGPYMNFTNQAFGNHNYSTTLTTDLGTTSSYSIAVDQDGWISSVLRANNYAGDIKLDLRYQTGIIERPMLRYDLSSVPANAAILSARAWFYVNMGHPQGPANIHALSADWTEANATWNSMGANMDSAVLASIPAQPLAGVWVSVNLTAQVQAWVNGQPNYGITLNSTSEGTHAEYASRESTQQPYLEVIVGRPPTGTAQLESVATLASGVTRTILRNDVVLQQQPSHDIHWQRDAALGVDAEIWDQSINTNYGNAAVTWVSSAGNDTTRSLLRFKMSAIPAGARILEATLSLYRKSGSGADQPVSAHRITNPWSEASVTWLSRETGTNWGTAGADFDHMAVATTPVGPQNRRYEWNIRPLVQGWVDGSYPNYGVVLAAAVNGMPGEEFFTSDNADPTKRPSLSITYACQCGVACLAPQGTGKVLIAVINPTTLVPEDAQKKALFESWGYTVNVISESANQVTYDAEALNNDVIYISNSVNAKQLGSKLAGQVIGVVSEDGDYNADLGISSGASWTTGSAVTITDNSHYITALFAAGALPIYAAPMEGLTVSGTQAGGLRTLADVGGAGSLVTLDVGAALAGGGTALGRRVMLPLGRSAGFNWNYLNNNGYLMLQRALAWAAGGGVLPPAGPVFEAFTEAGLGSDGTSLAINKPAGTAEGDLLIAAVATDGNNKSSLAPPAGWNIITVEDSSGGVTFGVWWKLAGAAEGGSYTFNWSAGEQAYGWIMRFSGHDPASPINIAASGLGSSKAPPSPAVISTVDSTLILRLGGFDDDDITPGAPGLAGHTAINMAGSGTGKNTASGGSGYVPQPAAGASGASSFTLTKIEQYVSVTIAIAPAP